MTAVWDPVETGPPASDRDAPWDEPPDEAPADDPAPAAGSRRARPWSASRWLPGRSVARRRPRPMSGSLAWFRERLATRPLRPDRSRALVAEPGGRFDRLDVWILIVLFAATLGLRTFRLAEPLQMHFDEVYHARTATEFLQALALRPVATTSTSGPTRTWPSTPWPSGSSPSARTT